MIILEVLFTFSEGVISVEYVRGSHVKLPIVSIGIYADLPLKNSHLTIVPPKQTKVPLITAHRGRAAISI